MNVANEFLTVKEVSEYLKIRPGTLYAWAERGIIPCYKIGRLLRFKAGDINTWVESLKEDRSPLSLAIPENSADIEGLIEGAKSVVLSLKQGKARLASRKGGE